MALLLCHYLGIYDGHSPITLLIKPYLEQQLVVVTGPRLESVPSVIIELIREDCFSVFLLWEKTTIYIRKKAN